MANEPERPIEKLLRAAAQKRRDEAGAPFALHPADRRLLQGEVTRKFAKPQRESRSFAEAVAQLWPRLAGGVAILAVLGLAVWVLLPLPGNQKSETFLAKNLPASKDMPANEPLPAAVPAPATIAPSPAPAVKTESQMLAFAETARPAPPDAARQLGAVPSPLAEEVSAARQNSLDAERFSLAAPQKLADRREQAGTQPAASRGTAAPAPAVVASGALDRQYGAPATPAPPASLPTAPAAPTTVAMTTAEAGRALAEGSARVAGEKAAQPGTFYKSLAAADSVNRPSPSAVAADSLSKAAPELLQQARAWNVAQRFVQVPTESKAKASLADSSGIAHPVLASFQLEQAGQALRIVDADGSVYTGSLQLASVVRRGRAANAEKPAVALTARAPTEALEQEVASRLDSDQLAQQTYSFRVAGTNRSLQENVVFTGNLLTATNLTLALPGATNLSFGGGLGGVNRGSAVSNGAANLNLRAFSDAFQNATAQPGSLPLLNSRISGKVLIGTGKAVEINALPANP